MTNSTTTTTCPKCGRTLELKSAQAHFEDTLSPTASNPNEWARGLRGAATYEGRLYAVCVCTPQGPVLEMPQANAGRPQDAPGFRAWAAGDIIAQDAPAAFDWTAPDAGGEG